MNSQLMLCLLFYIDKIVFLLEIQALCVDQLFLIYIAKKSAPDGLCQSPALLQPQELYKPWILVYCEFVGWFEGLFEVWIKFLE